VPLSPQNQNRVLVLAHLLNRFVDPLHSLGQTDEASEARPRAQLLPQQLIFLLQLDGPRSSLQPRAQLFDAKRFRDVVDRAHPCGRHR
jgi:hypothetical protein